jgi:hypothetical protein
MSLDPAKALGHLPQGLRDELVNEYQKIVRNYREQRWEAAELDGGRFSEIVYTILQGYVDGSYPAKPSKPNDFPSACNGIAKADKTTFPKSVRLGLPKVLISLYDIRNNRGVGHVGGEVDANHMDANFVLHTAQWVMAELVRIFHDTDVVVATATVDALIERTLPLIWKVGEVTRVLDETMPLGDATLLLLYSSIAGLSDKSLMTSLEQPKMGNYKRVLNRLHDQRMVEYSASTSQVVISPKGIKHVEERLLPKAQI